MAETTTKTTLDMNLVDTIATGVATAIARVEDTKAMNEQQKAVENQNKPSAVEQKLAAVNANLVKSNEQNASNIESIQSLFSEATKMLAQMTLPKDDNKASAPSAAAAMNSMAANDMSLAANGAGVSGGILGQLKSFFTSSAPTTQLAPDANGQVNQQVGTDLPKNDAASDRKALLEEEDRAYKAAVRPVMPKLSQALDKFLDGSITLGTGKNTSDDSGFSLQNLIMGLLGGAGGAILGFGLGYLERFGKAWAEVAADGAKQAGKLLGKFKNWAKDTSVGKKLIEWKNALTGAINSGITKIGELKTSVLNKFGEIKASFTGMLEGWKTSMKESTAGKAIKGVAEAAKKAGSWFGNLAKKVGGGLADAAKWAGGKALQGVKAGGKLAMKYSGVGIAMNAAKKVMPMAKALGKRVPQLQAVAGVMDTAANVYAGFKNNASGKEIRDMILAGTVNAVSDVLMLPELLNAAEGAIDAAVKGGSVTDVLKGAGRGMFKERDANEISLGDAAVARGKRLVGAEDEASKRLLDSYDKGGGWKEAGYDVISGSAGGFGHSAALYRPKAAGSMENSRTPNATITDKMPDVSNMSEADKMNALADKLADGVKNAWLSPEVQEANARNAQATGTAINGSLFGG